MVGSFSWQIKKHYNNNFHLYHSFTSGQDAVQTCPHWTHKKRNCWNYFTKFLLQKKMCILLRSSSRIHYTFCMKLVFNRCIGHTSSIKRRTFFFGPFASYLFFHRKGAIRRPCWLPSSALFFVKFLSHFHTDKVFLQYLLLAFYRENKEGRTKTLNWKLHRCYAVDSKPLKSIVTKGAFLRGF